MAKEKLWGGRFHEGTAASVEAYTQSISYDWALYKQDIAGSCAHARMLARQGVIKPISSSPASPPCARKSRTAPSSGKKNWKTFT